MRGKAVARVTTEPFGSIGVVPAGAPPPPGVRRLHVVLIKPSKYDDDGYVVRYVRGVLPSNTLATLAALTSRAVAREELGPVDVRVRIIDELVEKVDARELARRCLRRGARAVVALCGVQTNQFPRAADLARELRAAGLPVMIGGFHVSGAIAMSPSGIPPECRALIDEGITLVKGEVEDCWGDLLRDALHGRLKAYYDVVDAPDLSNAPVPVVHPRLMKRFAYPNMGTIDAGRGCPFNCHFCTIINVQGRTMRHRCAERIKDRVRRNHGLKIDYYFFTDDNFARNPEWEGIFDALIALRRDEGIEVQFMMQIDTAAYRIPGFVSKAKEAGCSQVFIGMETLNPENIPASGKRQNHVEDYSVMIDAWHAQGVACHVGYIIGFPFDTVESVRQDVRRLRDDIGVDQASFFMLMPLPGSQDHAGLVRRGEWVDPDYNRFDSFHPTTRHPRMTHEEWLGAYHQAWREFYSTDSMKAILSRANDVTYWGLFKNYLWFKYAIGVERMHPMIAGFFRLKDRRQRRPGFSVESRFAHLRRRSRDLVSWARGVNALYFEMQEVWLATRGRARLRREMDGLRQQYDGVRYRLHESAARAGVAIRERGAGMRAGAETMIERAGEARRTAAEDMRSGFGRVRERGSSFAVRARAIVGRLNPFGLRRRTRADLNAYWERIGERLRHGQFFRINPLKLAVNVVRDARLCVLFNVSILRGYGR